MYTQTHTHTAVYTASTSSSSSNTSAQNKPLRAYCNDHILFKFTLCAHEAVFGCGCSAAPSVDDCVPVSAHGRVALRFGLRSVCLFVCE